MLKSPEHKLSSLSESYVIVDTGSEPITLPDAKEWLRIEHNADDNLIQLLIKAVREQCTRVLQLDLKRITRFAEYSELGVNVALPYGIHGEVTLVEAVQSDSTKTALNLDSDYFVFGNRFKTLKITDPYNLVGLEVTFESGYEAANLPAPLKILMLRTLADNYENRESILKGSIAIKIPSDALKIAEQFTRRNWF